jgi:hypothetical protein
VLLKLTIAMLIMFAIAVAGEWTIASALDNALRTEPAPRDQLEPVKSSARNTAFV